MSRLDRAGIAICATLLGILSLALFAIGLCLLAFGLVANMGSRLTVIGYAVGFFVVGGLIGVSGERLRRKR